jgi:hypothetical protein
MRARSETDTIRGLRRAGYARVTINVEATLFGPVSLTFSIRRAGWHVRHQTWMFVDVRDACDQICRTLVGNRKLIHRFALILDEGVFIDVVLPDSGPSMLEALQQSLRKCFEKRGLSLSISVLHPRQLIEAKLHRENYDEPAQMKLPVGADQTNVVTFPYRLSLKPEPDASLGTVFVDEPALTSLAMRLYPFGIRRLSDLSQNFITRLYRSEVGSARYRVLILLEGWMIENQIDLA